MKSRHLPRAMATYLARAMATYLARCVFPCATVLDCKRQLSRRRHAGTDGVEARVRAPRTGAASPGVAAACRAPQARGRAEERRRREPPWRQEEELAAGGAAHPTGRVSTGPVAALVRLEYVRGGGGKKGAASSLPRHVLRDPDRLTAVKLTLSLDLQCRRLRVSRSSPPGHHFLHGIHDPILRLFCPSHAYLCKGTRARRLAPGARYVSKGGPYGQHRRDLGRGSAFRMVLESTRR